MGYTLLLSLIEYKTLVMRGDFDAANEILPQIPQVRSRTLQPSVIHCLQFNAAMLCSCDETSSCC